jgi:hypothetical protein
MRNKNWYGVILILVLILAASLYAREKLTASEEPGSPKGSGVRQAQGCPSLPPSSKRCLRPSST